MLKISTVQIACSTILRIVPLRNKTPNLPSVGRAKKTLDHTETVVTRFTRYIADNDG